MHEEDHRGNSRVPPAPKGPGARRPEDSKVGRCEFTIAMKKPTFILRKLSRLVPHDIFGPLVSEEGRALPVADLAVRARRCSSRWPFWVDYHRD
jgi:hypothetical protein